MIITAHKGQDKKSKMAKLIGVGPYVTAVGPTIPDGFVLYAKSGDDIKYSIKPVDEFRAALIIKNKLEAV